MRWNEETKGIAIKMIQDNISQEEIAKKTNMSISSVRLLKYSVCPVSLGKVICEICKEEFKQITQKHLNHHNISIEEYHTKFPYAKTMTAKRQEIYLSFKSANKGKTYEEIYGKEEGDKKRNIISQKQIGRPAPKLAGTGITGTRKDTNMFARSTYEANVDRIFLYENKRIDGEFSENNERVELIKRDGTKISYQPDRIDIDGLFEKGAYLEIKGYMYPDDWEKICLFREQYSNKKLIIISKDKEYLDINYSELKNKYKDLIPLWETESQNYKNRPDLYKIDYIEPEVAKRRNENYKDGINNCILNGHIKSIARKCISYNRVAKGDLVFVDSVELISISNRRCGASRKSSGVYNFELWKITCDDKKTFYVTNQEKTNLFYCYESEKINDLMLFFENNCDMSLKFGQKKEIEFTHISNQLIETFSRKELLMKIENILDHRGENDTFVVNNVTLIKKEKARIDAENDREQWKVEANGYKYFYILSNFDCATTKYQLNGPIYKEE